MTDAELADYLGIADYDEAVKRKFIAGLGDKRATYERLYEVEFDLNLWLKGIGPKPDGVIICHEHKSKHPNAES